MSSHSDKLPLADEVIPDKAGLPAGTLQQASGSALFSLQSAIVDEMLSSKSDSDKLGAVLALLRDAFEFDAVVFLAAEDIHDQGHVYGSTDQKMDPVRIFDFANHLKAGNSSGLIELGSDDLGNNSDYMQAWYQFAHGLTRDDLKDGVLVGFLKDRRERSAFPEAAIQAIAPTFRLISGTITTGHKLSAATQRFESLASSLPGVVYQRRVFPDGDIRYTYISESAKKLFGISAAEILGNPKALFASYAPEYAESFRAKLLEASKSLAKWDVEASIIMPDGSRKYTHAIATPKLLLDGSVLWTGVILDASRIKKAEMKAAAAEDRSRRAIVESLAQGLIMFDPDGKVKIYNAQFKAYFPEIAEEVENGIEYSDLIKAELARTNSSSPHRRVDALLRERLKAHQDGKPYNIEHKIGEDTWVQVDEHRTEEGETVIVYTNVSEIKRREARIQHMAMHDALTGLPNRSLFRDRIQQAVYDSGRYKNKTAIICLDLDNFKNVNDTLGHPAGDELLRIVADRLTATVRDVDTVARLGGDEFAIILNDIGDLNEVDRLAQRVIELLSEPFELKGNQVVIGTSIGISLCDSETNDADELIKNADLALYRAKFDGKNTYRFFEIAMDELAQARRLLERDLRKALDESFLELHFQPQIDVKRKVVCGFEALVRWHHPERGTVSPNKFISLAEETGLIGQLGEWVLLNACQSAASWSKPVKIAVNLSPAQFKRTDLVEYVAQVLETTGLDPTRLELEITESLLLHNTDDVMDKLFRLKGLGVRVAMDDFGTGFSSLGNLRSFPFDRIKIDRSFVRGIGKNSESAAIVKAVIGLGDSLGISTTAEGVETADQLDYLIGEGCLEVQGFYYSHARPGEQVECLLERKLGSFRSLGLVDLLGEDDGAGED